MNAPVQALSAESEDVWSVAGRTFRSRLIIGTGKYKDYSVNAAATEAAGAEIVTVAVRRGEPVRPVPADAGRLCEARPLHLPAQHRRLLHRRGRDPHPTPGARSGRLELGQAGGAERSQAPLSRHGGDAAGAQVAGRRRLPGDGLLLRRPGLRPQAGGGGRRRHHAAGRSHRLGAGHPEPGEHPPDRGAVTRARAGRRRRGRGLGTPRSPWSSAATGC